LALHFLFLRKRAKSFPFIFNPIEDRLENVSLNSGLLVQKLLSLTALTSCPSSNLELASPLLGLLDDHSRQLKELTWPYLWYFGDEKWKAYLA
jgi:hypothetical protein